MPRSERVSRVSDMFRHARRHASGHAWGQRSLTPDTDTRDGTNGPPQPWSERGWDADAVSCVSSAGAVPKGPASPGRTPSSAAPPFMRAGWGITRGSLPERGRVPGAGTPSRALGPRPRPREPGQLCQPSGPHNRPHRARYGPAHARAEWRLARTKRGSVRAVCGRVAGSCAGRAIRSLPPERIPPQSTEAPDSTFDGQLAVALWSWVT